MVYKKEHPQGAGERPPGGAEAPERAGHLKVRVAHQLSVTLKDVDDVWKTWGRYRALVTEVTDGDTVYADLHVGRDIWQHEVALRLWGIGTPEIWPLRTRIAGEAARDFLCATLLGISLEQARGLPKVKRGPRVRVQLARVPILVETYGEDRKGKYGRLLTTLRINLGGELVNVNELMLSSGHAIVPAYL